MQKLLFIVYYADYVMFMYIINKNDRNDITKIYNEMIRNITNRKLDLEFICIL